MRRFFQLLAVVTLAVSPAVATADTIMDVTLGGTQQGVAVDPSTNRIYLVASPPFGGPGVYVIDGATHQRQDLALPSAFGVAVDPIAGKVYVTDPSNDRLWIIDGTTLAKTPVDIGDNPSYVAVNPATNRIYVVHVGANMVTVVDGATLATSTVAVGAEPRGIAVNAATNRIFVTNKSGNSLSVIDGATNTAVTVPVAAGPWALAVDPVLDKVFITHGGSAQVAVVNGTTLATSYIAASGTAVAVNPIDHRVYVGSPGAIVVIDGSSETVVTSMARGGLALATVLTTHKTYAAGTDGAGCRPSCPMGPTSVIDGATDTVLQTFAGVGATSFAVNPVTNRIYEAYNAAGSGFFYGGLLVIDGASEPKVNLPIGMIQPVAVNPVTNRVYLGNGTQVLVMDGESDAPLATVPMSAAGPMIGVNPVTNKIYVPNSGGTSSSVPGTVTVIDGATNGTVTVQTGRQPDFIAVNPATNRIYTTSILDDSVTVIDGDTLATVTIPAGDYPERPALDIARNLVYVPNRFGGTVTVIDGATNATTTVPVGPSPGTIAVDMVSGKVFVPLLGEDKVAVFAPPDNVVTKIPVGLGPNDIVFNPVTRLAYVMNMNGHSVSIIDAVTNTVVDTVSVPDGGLSILADPGANRVYVGSASYPANLNVLTVIDGATHAKHDITVNTGYHNLAVNPITRKVYVGSQGATGLTVISDPRQVMGPATFIGALPGNKSTSVTPSFTFTAGTGLNGAAARAVFFQVDTYQGAWKRASGNGPFSGTLSALTPGLHVLYAYAVDAHVTRPDGPSAGPIAAYAFTVTAECLASPCADLGIQQEAIPPAAQTKKDIVMKLTTTNAGGAQASNVVLTNPLPAGAQFIWAQPPCSHAGGVVTCPIGTMAAGASSVLYHVYRMPGAGTVTNNVSVSGAPFDPQSANNASAVDIPVTASPAGVPVKRYRLYSDVTKEHHFTTDLNEYNTLGSYTGTWVQEGEVGKVLDNPGSFGGLEAVPYYRLYDPSTRWHHWTTDPNEYFTLALSGWNAEGPDGYILPSQVAGTTQLFRLNYPPLGSLHHWTIDENEYNALINDYGWIGEGGSGFVVQ